MAAVQAVYETRPNTGLQIVRGRVEWCVRSSGSALTIIEKRVTLVGVDCYLENLTFVLWFAVGSIGSAMGDSPVGRGDDSPVPP